MDPTPKKRYTTKILTQFQGIQRPRVKSPFLWVDMRLWEGFFDLNHKPSYRLKLKLGSGPRVNSEASEDQAQTFTDSQCPCFYP